MTDGKIKHLVLIVSYRDNEVGTTHPLFETLKNLEQEKCDISRIHLNPLNMTHIIQLITDTLQSGKRPGQRSGGTGSRLKPAATPFFVNQFLIMLYQEQLMTFNIEHGYWEWNLPNIRALDITDNVVDLLLSRLELMPADTQTVVMMAACIGSNFDIKILRTITGFSDAEVITHLLPAVREDLVITIPQSHEANPNEENLPAIMAESFKFRHDRVRQAGLCTDRTRK